MSDPLNCSIVEYHIDYPQYSLLEEYVNYFKSINSQTKNNIIKFINQLPHYLWKDKCVFAVYCGIMLEMKMDFDEDVGISLFVRAISVHKDQELAKKIISETDNDYGDNYIKLITMTSDEDVLKVFLTNVADFVIKQYFNEIVLLIQEEFPEMCARWINENIDKYYKRIITAMTKHCSDAEILINLIDVKIDKNHDDLLMKRIIKLGDEELLVSAVKKRFA